MTAPSPSTAEVLRILVVDDSATSTKFVRRTLSQLNARLEVSTAERLSEAVAVIAKDGCDIVLLDLELPDSSGIDTVVGVRDRFPNLPIVILTSTEDEQVAISAIQHGCQDYIIKKTINPFMLWRIVVYSIERKRAEIALIEERTRLKDYIDTSSEWFWEAGPEFRFTYVSDNASEVMGIDPAAFLGHSLPEIPGMATPSGDWAEYFDVVREGRAFTELELRYAASPEDTVWLRLSGKPLYDRSNHLRGFRGVGLNVTLDKFAEWELTNKKALFDGVLQSSRDAFLVLEAIYDSAHRVADFKILHVNRRSEELFGRIRVHLLGRLFYNEFPDLVRYGLYERARQCVMSGASFEVEQFYNDKGLVGWFRVVGVRLDKKIILTFSDITARVEAERDQRLAAAVFRTTHDALLVTDENVAIVSINPSFTRLTGYTVDDVIGRNPRMLSSGRHSRLFFAEMWKALIETGFWNGNIMNRHKDGNVYIQRSSISVIRNDRGDVTNFVCLASDVTNEYQEMEQQRLRANSDPLTGLPNRFLLLDRLEHAIPRAQRDSRMVALLFIDLDAFKPVNDVFGHLAGDRVLGIVARRLTECVRDSDTVARLGGDEFVILLLDVRHPEDACAVADKVLEAVSLPISIGGTEVKVGACVGIAVFPNDGTSAELLLNRADGAMYEAKRAGKNCWRVAVAEV